MELHDPSFDATGLYNLRAQMEADAAESDATTQAKVPVIAMEDDAIGVPGQSFAVISFVDKRDYTGVTEGDSRNKGAAQNLLKIRGVYPTHERAQSRVKSLLVVDPYFEIHIVKCGAWTTIGAGSGEDVVYENDGVQGIMQGFFDQHYTDLDKMKERISSAKAAGVPHLEANDADKFYSAATGFDAFSVADEALPAAATEMSMREAAESIAPAFPPGLPVN